MSTTLPEFNADAVLPPGDYCLTLDELAESHLVWGSNEPSTFDHERRGELVNGLAILVEQLWEVGLMEIFVDGSFTEAKDRPNDIDGYFECERKRLFSGDLERELNRLDQHQCWTWDPTRLIRYEGKLQLPMRRHYRVELYPHYGQLCKIYDKFGNELVFPSAFRQQRFTYKPKGIVKVVKEGLSHD